MFFVCFMIAFTLMLIGQIQQTGKRFGTTGTGTGTSEHGAAAVAPVQSSSTEKGKGHENDHSPTHVGL